MSKTLKDHEVDFIRKAQINNVVLSIVTSVRMSAQKTLLCVVVLVRRIRNKLTGKFKSSD